ncbi:MAG: NeuD/PglB/VioB family sugar acetyltransferase [Vampirovibrio sp.]|nr:NeuD/PglB/VioB family sugar acetyltransferase [Vampirovibrio sp.]
MTTPLILMGTGDHALVMLDFIQREGFGEVLGVLSPCESAKTWTQTPVLGSDSDVAKMIAKYPHAQFVVAIGNNATRLKVGNDIEKLGGTLASIISKTAVISPQAVIGAGGMILPFVVVHPKAEVGRLALLNTGAIVEHHCQLGEAVHLAPRSVLGGRVTVGSQTLMGVGACAKPAVTIGANVTVGAGSAVVADVANGLTVCGVPAKPL